MWLFTEFLRAFIEIDSIPMRLSHPELHRTDRIGWLRAAVLGANDGIVSTASLVVGVAAANTSGNDVLIAGVAGLVAGAMSMAAGEYVSVVVATSILFLALLGGFGAYAGGAPWIRAAVRVTFWGSLAMAITAGVGALFGAVV